MKSVNGYINSIDVNEFSKLTGVNNNVQNQTEHVVWECPDCSDMNVIFKLKEGTFGGNPIICKCDSCKRPVKVYWDMRRKLNNVIDVYDGKVEGQFEDSEQ
jgi:predicted RNA-binding Zn-ribbon protein involved in translation (DUF1610 family)